MKLLFIFIHIKLPVLFSFGHFLFHILSHKLQIGFNKQFDNFLIECELITNLVNPIQKSNKSCG